jgi:ornithine cyclodeaminase/alanine dehydrogenase-like protein (mu-crystallin family)
MNPRFISAQEIAQNFLPADAVSAVITALQAGLDPAKDLPRSILPIEKGELLLMPATSSAGSGIKVLTIAPENAALGQPRIQGLYFLFDPITLATTTIMDGAAVTTLRTPAISIAAISSALNELESDISLVIFGSGPQGIAHVKTIAAILIEKSAISEVTFIVRDIEKARLQIPNKVLLGISDSASLEIVELSSVTAQTALRKADIVVAATTATTPLFDSQLLKDSVIAIAVGSHDKAVRELDSALMGRSQVIVETRASALREGGDVIMAIAEGALAAASLLEMADVVCGRVKLRRGRAIVFKSSGMSWEDLVIARAIAAKVEPA